VNSSALLALNVTIRIPNRYRTRILAHKHNIFHLLTSYHICFTIFISSIFTDIFRSCLCSYKLLIKTVKTVLISIFNPYLLRIYLSCIPVFLTLNLSYCPSDTSPTLICFITRSRIEIGSNLLYRWP